MNTEILTKVRNLLVDPFSWNGLKQQLTLVDTHFARLAHTRETPREKPITITPSLSHVLHCPDYSPFSLYLIFRLSFSFSLSFPFSLSLSRFIHVKIPMHPTIDRKKRALLTVEMIISTPMMPFFSLTPFPREWILHSPVLLMFSLKLTFRRKTMNRISTATIITNYC